jgi:hypothetical protein
MSHSTNSIIDWGWGDGGVERPFTTDWYESLVAHLLHLDVHHIRGARVVVHDVQALQSHHL